MQELDFSITINLSIALNEDKASINIKNVDLTPAVISLPVRLNSRDSTSAPKTQKKKTIHDIILQTAKKCVVDTGQNKFTGAKLFHIALLNHPELKRNTFAAQVIAAAPNHSSHRHYPNRKDFFTYLGKGYYKLNQKYLAISEDQIMSPSDRVREHVKNTSILPKKMVKNPCPYGPTIFTRSSDSQDASRWSARRFGPVSSKKIVTSNSPMSAAPTIAPPQHLPINLKKNSPSPPIHCS